MPFGSLLFFGKGIEVERSTGKLKMISESIILEGGEFEWPIRVVLTARATAKSNRAKASPKAAIPTALSIARMLGRLLQANANVDTRGANRAIYGMAAESRHPSLNSRNQIIAAAF